MSTDSSADTDKHVQKPRSMANLVLAKTHLMLDNGGLEEVPRLHSAKASRRLKVLSLRRNRITNLENLRFLPALTRLHLDENCVDSIQDYFKLLGTLERLHLNGNLIQTFEGLDACHRLRELSLARQKGIQPLSFAPKSLECLSVSLKFLDVSGNRLKSLEPFEVLHRLRDLVAANNEVASLQNTCAVMLELKELERIDVTGNPICFEKGALKSLMSSTSLGRLRQVNRKLVTPKNHEFVTKLVAGKRQRALDMGSGNMKTVVDPFPLHTGWVLGGRRDYDESFHSMNTQRETVPRLFWKFHTTSVQREEKRWKETVDSLSAHLRKEQEHIPTQPPEVSS